MKKAIQNVLRLNPGLKGREIARNIGEDRRVVNSFLSRNKEDFSQNDEYQWFNKNDETIIEFESGWTDAESFERQLSEYPDLFSVNKKLKFVLPKGCNLLLESISRFLALLNQLDHHGVEIVVDLAECGKTRSFLDRAGFFDLLAEGVDILPKRPSSSAAKIYKGNNSSLVELGAICPKSRNKGLVIALRSSFVEKSSEEYSTASLTVFSEFINNVGDHSESPLEGFAALQFYNPPRQRQHIQTVISDSGLGVVNTLRTTLQSNYPELYKRFPYRSEDNNIGLVLEVFSKGNITRHTHESGRGLGFLSSREQASKFDADLTIRLETYNIKLLYRDGVLAKPIITKQLTEIKGTHICFDFYVD